MNFDLSDDQAMFRATAERFAAPIDGEARRRLRAVPGGYSRERWRELAELGLIALTADESMGGMGGTRVDLAVVAEALGSAVAPDPWLENGVLPALLLGEARAETQLSYVLNSNCFVAVAMAERAQRYRLDPRATRATRDGDGFRLTGEKTLVLGGELADLLLVSADLEGTPAWFAIPANAEGLRARSYRIVDGSCATELALTNVRLASDARLDISGHALQLIVAEVRLLAAAEMLGLGQRLLDDTLAYVRQREQFGVPLSSFQALQHRLVDCYVALEQARSMLWRTALDHEADRAAWVPRADGAKSYIADNVMLIAREAVQMHGGMGVTEELAVGHALKRLLLLEQLFGDRSEGLAHYAEAA